MIDRAFSVIGYIWSSIVNILDGLIFPGTTFSMWTFVLAFGVLSLILVVIHKLYDFGGVSK